MEGGFLQLEELDTSDVNRIINPEKDMAAILSLPPSSPLKKKKKETSDEMDGSDVGSLEEVRLEEGSGNRKRKRKEREEGEGEEGEREGAKKKKRKESKSDPSYTSAHKDKQRSDANPARHPPGLPSSPSSSSSLPLSIGEEWLTHSLSPLLLEGIAKCGFKAPTAIQKEVIKAALEREGEGEGEGERECGGCDVIAAAETGV